MMTADPGRCRREPVRGEEPEILLFGGTANRGQVVRVGETVRRPQRPTESGDPCAAAPPGRRRVLGRPALPRHRRHGPRGPDVRAGHSHHAAVPRMGAHRRGPAPASLRCSAPTTPRSRPSIPARTCGRSPRPPPFSGELISHNDLNLDNVVFRDGRAVALIDFDLASPGSRLWDVAGAVRLWAPLRPDHHIHDERRGRALDRLRLFVDRYDLADEDRERLVEAVRQSHTWIYDLIGGEVANGHAGFSDYYAGAQDRATETYEWYLDNGELLRRTLL